LESKRQIFNGKKAVLDYELFSFYYNSNLNVLSIHINSTLYFPDELYDLKSLRDISIVGSPPNMPKWDRFKNKKFDNIYIDFMGSDISQKNLKLDSRKLENIDFLSLSRAGVVYIDPSIKVKKINLYMSEIVKK
jgi:hypothetical protein